MLYCVDQVRGDCPKRAEATASGAADFSSDWISERVGAAERRQITVLSCGSVIDEAGGYEADPELLSDELMQLRNRFIATVERYGGLVEPETGLSLLGYWGHPCSPPDPVRLAVQAALDLVQGAGNDSRIQCGVDVGLAVVGRANRPGPRIVSLAIRAAQSLQTAAPPGSVSVSDAVRRQASHAFEFEAAPSAHSGESWLVRKMQLDASRNWAGASPNPVGREAVLDRLRAIWGGVLAGEARYIAITGEPGIGKSTVLRELGHRAVETGAAWIEIACLPEHRREPLQPVRHGLLTAGDRAGTNMKQCLSRLDPPDRALLEIFLGVRPRQPGDDAVPGAEGCETLLRAIMNLLAVRAVDAPLLLTFEDVEWSDPATLALIGSLARKISVLGRICVACTWRNGHTPIAVAPPHLTLELQRLPRAGVLSLLAGSPYSGHLSDHDRRQIAELSEGVPLIAVELAALRSSGHDLGNSRALLGSLGPALLPRLDALRSLKPLARAATVLGRQFEAGVLAAVLEMDEAGLVPKLDALVELGFLRRAGNKARRYRLAQPLLGKVAYASLLTSRRRRLHQRAGEVLGSDPATVERRPDIVARHFAKAGDFGAAFTWWRKAGERAALASAARKSVDYFRKALKCRTEDRHAGSEEEEAEVTRLLAVQLVALKGNGAPEVVSALQHSIDLSPCGKQDPFDALWALHASYLVRGEVVRALQIGEDLKHCVGPGAPDHKRIRLHRIQGLAKLLAGCLQEAFAHYRLALGLYDEARHSYLRFHYASDQGAISYAQIAWGEAIAAEYEQSAAHARLALDLASRLRHPHTSAHVACVLGARAHALGDRATAAAMAYAGRTLGERYEFPYWVSWADLLLGWVEGERGSASGVGRIECALEAYQRTGAGQALPFGQLLLAETLLATGQPEAAREAALHGVRLAQHYGLRLYLAELLRVEARAQVQLGASAENAKGRIRGAEPPARRQGAARLRGTGNGSPAGALSDDRIVQESDTLLP